MLVMSMCICSSTFTLHFHTTAGQQKDMTSVVTVSLFSRSVVVDRCFHEKVGGRFQFRCLYMFTKRCCTAFMMYSLALWA